MLEASPTTLKGDANLDRFIDSVVSTLTDPIDRAFARSFATDTSSDDLPTGLVDELPKGCRQACGSKHFATLQTYDDTEHLERISVPTLPVWGDADHLVTRAMQDALVERIRSAELRIYERAGQRRGGRTRLASRVTSQTSRREPPAKAHELDGMNLIT